MGELSISALACILATRPLSFCFPHIAGRADRRPLDRARSMDQGHGADWPVCVGLRFVPVAVPRGRGWLENCFVFPATPVHASVWRVVTADFDFIGCGPRRVSTAIARFLAFGECVRGAFRHWFRGTFAAFPGTV